MEMQVLTKDVNNYKLNSPTTHNNNNNNHRNYNNNRSENNMNNNNMNNFDNRLSNYNSNNNTNKSNNNTNNNNNNSGSTNNHREMAVDCPQSFVGVKKETPKYPRPSSLIQSASNLHQPATSTLQSHPTISQPSHTQPPPPTHPPPHPPPHINAYTTVIIPSQNRNKTLNSGEDDDDEEDDEGDEDGDGGDGEDDGGDGVISSSEQQRQSLRVLKYQQDLQARKAEEEGRLGREDGRGSLRNSSKIKKLQGSWKLRSHTGCFNSSFIHDEDDGVVGSRKTSWKKKRIPYLDVTEIVNSVRHVQKHIEDDEERDKLDRVSELVRDERFQQILKVHNKVVDIKLSGDRKSVV